MPGPQSAGSSPSAGARSGSRSPSRGSGIDDARPRPGHHADRRRSRRRRCPTTAQVEADAEVAVVVLSTTARYSSDGALWRASLTSWNTRYGALSSVPSRAPVAVADRSPGTVTCWKSSPRHVDRDVHPALRAPRPAPADDRRVSAAPGRAVQGIGAGRRPATGRHRTVSCTVDVTSASVRPCVVAARRAAPGQYPRRSVCFAEYVGKLADCAALAVVQRRRRTRRSGLAVDPAEGEDAGTVGGVAVHLRHRRRAPGASAAASDRSAMCWYSGCVWSKLATRACVESGADQVVVVVAARPRLANMSWRASWSPPSPVKPCSSP